MMTEDRLNALVDLLYERAIDGDSRTGLALVKLYDKTLKVESKEQVGLIFLPEMSESDTEKFIQEAEPQRSTRIIPAKKQKVDRIRGSFADRYEDYEDGEMDD